MTPPPNQSSLKPFRHEPSPDITFELLNAIHKRVHQHLVAAKMDGAYGNYECAKQSLRQAIEALQRAEQSL